MDFAGLVGYVERQKKDGKKEEKNREEKERGRKSWEMEVRTVINCLKDFLKGKRRGEMGSQGTYENMGGRR